MKVDIDRDTFAAALSRAKGCTGKDGAVPMLRNVLVRSDGERTLSIEATDLEISISIRVDAVVHEAGGCAIPAKEALDLVRGLPERKVAVALTGGKALIAAGGARRWLHVLPVEDFPYVRPGHTELYPCPKGRLARAVSEVLYVVPSGSDAYSIPGVYVTDGPDQSARLVGTDGHRLAFCGLVDPDFTRWRAGEKMILPRKGLVELLKLLDGDDEVSIARAENGVLFKSAGTTMTMRFLDGEFPDYEVIIPEERHGAVILDGSALLAALKSMLPLASAKSSAVHIQIASGRLLLSMSSDLGRAEDEMDVDYDGPDFSVHYNGRYLIEALQAMDGERVRFEWVDESHGGVFLDPAAPRALHLIMPMLV